MGINIDIGIDIDIDVGNGMNCLRRQYHLKQSSVLRTTLHSPRTIVLHSVVRWLLGSNHLEFYMTNITTGDYKRTVLILRPLTFLILKCRRLIFVQDPVLFSATLRRNLDPNNEYLDTDLWLALHEVISRFFSPQITTCTKSIMHLE